MLLPGRIGLITGSALTAKSPVVFPITRCSRTRNRNHKLSFIRTHDLDVNVCRIYPR